MGNFSKQKQKRIDAIYATIEKLKLQRDTEMIKYYAKMYQERIDFFHKMLVDVCNESKVL